MKIFGSIKKVLHNKKIVLLTLGFSSVIGLVGCGKGKTEYVPLYRSVQIEKGDTLSELAQDFYENKEYKNTEVYKSYKDLMKEVMQINHMDDPDYLNAGGYLIVPYYVTPEQAEEISAQTKVKERRYVVEYCVQKYDTLENIAHYYDTSVNAVCKQSNYGGYIPLSEGMILSIPTTIGKAVENGDLSEDYVVEMAKKYREDQILAEEDAPKRR